MIDQALKERVFSTLIGCQISTYTSSYAPDEAVVTISNLLQLIENSTKYRIRKCLKALMADGVICYKSQGCPAVVSYGEVTELVCDSAPPINGYTLTSKGYQTPEWRTAYEQWEKSMEEWANGFDEKDGEQDE